MTIKEVVRSHVEVLEIARDAGRFIVADVVQLADGILERLEQWTSNKMS